MNPRPPSTPRPPTAAPRRRPAVTAPSEAAAPSGASNSPKALSRQHSIKHSVSPRGLAPSLIRPLQRQNPVVDSLSFNGGPAQPPLHSNTRLQVPPIPDPLARNDWLNFQHQNMGRPNAEFQSRALMPRRLSPESLAAASIPDPFAPFRNHMHTESGNIQLILDDGTTIDMGNVDINAALGMLRRRTYQNGTETYTVVGFYPGIEMIILDDGRIILLPPPPAKKGGRRRTISRKMGRKGRKGTNKCRRYIVAKTRLRRGNKMPRTLRN